MAPHINKMPPETVIDILRRVRNSCMANELTQFAGLLRCCRYWYGLAKHILWTDIALSNDTIGLFLAVQNAPNHTLVRSLTIRITPVLIEEDKEPREDNLRYLRSTFYHQNNVNNLCPGEALGANIRKLATVLPYMTSLKMFSFLVERFIDVHGHYEDWDPDRDVRGLLQNLPESCTAIEIDAVDLECKSRGSSSAVHLCTTVREIIPRMEHVRLSLGSPCESLFLKEEQHEQGRASKGAAKTKKGKKKAVTNRKNAAPGQGQQNTAQYITAPFLKTLLIKLSIHTRNSLTYSCLSAPNLALSAVLSTLNAAIAANALPQATQISVFDSGPEDTEDVDNIDHLSEDFGSYLDYSSYPTTLIEHDLLASRVIYMPYFDAPSFPEADFLRYLDDASSTSAAFGDYSALITLAEHQAWKTTLSGVRMPGDFAVSSVARDRGYVFKNTATDLKDDGEELGQKTRHLKKSGGLPEDPAGKANIVRELQYVRVRDMKTGVETLL